MFEDKKKPKKKPEGYSLSQAFGGKGGNGDNGGNGDDSNKKEIDLKNEKYSANLVKLGEATKQKSPTHPYLTPKKPTHKP